MDDGAQMRLYLDNTCREHVDVSPLDGTLVSFLSTDCYHEVLPACRPRPSLTGWFKTRAMRGHDSETARSGQKKAAQGRTAKCRLRTGKHQRS